MGMGYNACFDYVIEDDIIKKFCEQEWENLTKVLDRYNVSIEQLAQSVQFQQDLYEVVSVEEEEEEEIMVFYNELLKKFHNELGIQIQLSYHNSNDEGSRYDDVNGAFFVANWLDIVQYTPQVKAAEQKGVKIALKAWVQYG